MKEKFARWHILLLQYFKRDWKKIFIWILALGLFSAGFIPAFEEMAKGDGLIGMYETLRNPAMVSIVGPTPIKEASKYTLGAMYSHEMLLFSGLFAMIISILHVIGHTRKEEDLGLTELVRSFQVGRQANSLAVIVETIFINLILALFIGVIMISFSADGITTLGAFLFGFAIAIAGIIGAAIGILMAQIMPISSAATGSSLGIMGLLYLIRGGTDISNIKLSMLNPLGWVYLTYPFTENNWLTIIFGLIFSLVIMILALSLEGRRDMGAGYLPERQGRANAKKTLLSIPGLFIKLNKGTIISWLIAFPVLGAAYGAIYGDMETFLESNEMMKQMFTYSGISIEESFTSTIIMVMVLLVAILPIAIVNKLFSEERNLNLSQIHGTKVRRSQLYWTNIFLAGLVSIIGLGLAVGGLGGAALSVMKSTTMNIGDFLVVGYNLLPSILFFIGLAGLVLGWIPNLRKILYIYLSYSFFVNYFAGILNLPKIVINTSPISWLPKMPIESFKFKNFAIITIVSIGLTLLGYWGYKRRDMVEGA